MSKRSIWVEGVDFHRLVLLPLHLGITAPRLEGTRAALAFNRLAQETFEKHNCADSTHQVR